MNLFIDFSNEKDHPSIHDRYLSGRYSQTYPSRKQDTPEFFFPGTGIRTEERDSVYIQICHSTPLRNPERSRSSIY